MQSTSESTRSYKVLHHEEREEIMMTSLSTIVGMIPLAME